MSTFNESLPPEPIEQADGETKKQTAITWLMIGGVAALMAWRSPSFAIGVAKFVVTLSVLVFVHEWGHYQFARWAGMKVNRFALGFPPWIFTKRRNGIDYSIGALPIGGMVDIAGLGSEEEMIATAKGENENIRNSAEMGFGTAGTTVVNVDESNDRLAYDAQRQRAKEIPHGEKQFQDAPLRWRFWTLFAGPMMNFIYALLMFVAVYSYFGEPSKFTPTNTVEIVSVGDPADVAGIEHGDKIISVNGQRSDDPDKLAGWIRAGKGAPVKIQVERAGAMLDKTIRPVVREQDTEKGPQTRPIIGIVFLTRIDGWTRMSPADAVKSGVLQATFGARNILSMVGRAFVGRLTQTEVRDIGGPVKIGSAVTIMSRRGWPDFLLFTGMLSLNLGLINLLPLPALDGGRILFLGYELVMRRPIDARKETFVHTVGMVMLLAFMLFITVRDVLPYIAKGLRGMGS